MVYTEVQIKKGKKYYYRTLTLRKGKHFKKFRIYLGTELTAKELAAKEREANLIIHTQAEKRKRLRPQLALERLYHTKWLIYHKRSTLVPILTGGSLFDVFSTGLTPLLGDSWNQLLMIWHKGTLMACFPQNKVKQLGKIAFTQLQRDPHLIGKYHQIFHNKALKFIKELQAMNKKCNHHLKNIDIIKRYNWYYKEYNGVCIWGEPFPLVVHDELLCYLERLLQRAQPNKKECLDTFTLLITPQELSFVNREENDLRSIARMILTDKKLKDLFNSSSYSILNTLPEFPELCTLIKRHTKRYFWLQYDYFGNVLTEKDFVERLKELISQPTALNKDFNAQSQQLIRKQEVCFARLLATGKITEHDKELFIATQQATTLMDYKKEMLSQAHYYINQVLEIAAQRIGVPLRELIFSYRYELPKFLKRTLDKNILKKRLDKNAFYFTDKGMCIFTGKEVDTIVAFLEKGTDLASKEFSGICANPGTLIGKVKVLRSPQEISKLQKGDILVTGMTTPEYVPAMKKAAAIITNEGCITCHAAIVAREMGIPCVVGTKIATELLKDGDLVELHAATGVIKVINQRR